jgi:hypothetical protein
VGAEYGALVSAAFAAGLIGLTATTAGACTGTPHRGDGPPPAAAPASCPDPQCTSGVPPAAASLECTNPECVGGTPPAATLVSARWIRPPAVDAAVSEVSADAVTVNCPPPDSSAASR